LPAVTGTQPSWRLVALVAVVVVIAVAATLAYNFIFRCMCRHFNALTNELTSPRYLDTMRRVFEQALANGTETLIVLDDDAVMDCSFRSSLEKLLASDRCSAPLRPALAGRNRAGVLLLGAAIW